MQFDAAQATAFLALLDEVHLVAINPNGLAVEGRWFGPDRDAALAWAEVRTRNGCNVYWTVNRVRPGVNKKPAKGDITAARFAHVDIDPPRVGAWDEAGTLAKLGGMTCPPSFVSHSGNGVQAFWRFDGDSLNLEAVEEINRQLVTLFGADHCWNIDRLMRLPGTVNYPDAKKRARGRVPTPAWLIEADDGVVYEPHVLAASLPAAAPVPAAGVSAPMVLANVPVEFITPDDLGLGEFDEVRLAVCNPPGLDRSGDALAAARVMAMQRYSDAQIIGMLMNPANAVSAHVIGQRDPYRAAARCLARVREDMPEIPPAPMFKIDELIANIKRRTGGVRPAEEDDDRGDGAETLPAPRYTVPSGLPGWRRDLTGGLAMFVDHVTETAVSPQPLIALGAALAGFGVLAGRRYAGPSNLRTNLYCIGIADSGGGKDWPLSRAVSLFIAAGLDRLLGGSKIASGAALVSAASASPATFYPLDEFGLYLQAMTDPKRAPPHMSAIITNLMEFYSKAGATWLGTDYSDRKEKPRTIINQPCIGLFAVSTPSTFWQAIGNGNVGDGSLARMIVLESENNYPGANHDAGRSDIPPDLIDLAKAIVAGAEGHDALPLGEGASVEPRPFTVPFCAGGAAKRWREIKEEEIALLRQYEGTPLTSIIARMCENAQKMALVKAIADNPARPCMSVADLDWGYNVSKASVDKVMAGVRDNIAENDYERDLKRVMKAIADAGSAGMSMSQIARKFRSIDGRRRDSILADLVKSDSVRHMNMATSGAPRAIYFDNE